MKRQVGFTVGELLIVISIILLIAAILFPVMRNAKFSATRVTCAANLRQIYSALKLYESDYGAPAADPSQLLNAIPAVKSSLICPLDPSEGTRLTDGTPRGKVPHSYEMHYFLIARTHIGRSIWESPELMLAFCEWHSKRPQRGSLVGLALFGDGHIADYDLNKHKPWLDELMNTKR